MWLEQGPVLPVIPHTPAWLHTFAGRIPPRDVVALILAVRADASIYNEPRHLSWLAQQYVIHYRQPPVHNWPRFQQLAEMPIGEWPNEGHRLWKELCTHARKNMPWYLDEIFREAVLDGVIPYPETQYAPAHCRWDEYTGDDDEPYDGLNERPGESLFSAYGVWHVALGHIRMRIGDEPYYKWVEACEPVFYFKDKKELILRARDSEAAEILNTRFIEAIQKAVNGAAQGELSVRFVVGKFPREAPANAPDEAGQGGKPHADTPPDAPSAPDSS